MSKLSEYDMLSTQPGRWFVQRFQIYGLLIVGGMIGFAAGVIVSYTLADLAIRICTS